jgi:hypothetical protein
VIVHRAELVVLELRIQHGVHLAAHDAGLDEGAGDQPTTAALWYIESK